MQEREAFMYCTECGAQMASSAKFCAGCGTRNTMAEQKVTDPFPTEYQDEDGNWYFEDEGFVTWKDELNPEEEGEE